MEEDIERISALRRRVGNKLSLAVDANCMYDLRGAIKMARLMEPYDISFFEEPMAGENIEDVIRLREKSAIPIAGFETELSRFAMRDFIASRAVDIAQLDAIWSGGVSECMKIAAMADCYGMEIIPHFSAGAVSFAANLHVAAALANCPIIEYTLDPNPLRDDLATEKPLRTGEYVKLNDKPGLGVELDFDIVNRYRVK